MADEFAVSVERMGDAVTLVLTGDLDLASAPTLRNVVESAHDESVRQVVIDCAGLSFIDSSGLGALVGIRNRLDAVGCALELTNVQPVAARTITIGGLAEALGVAPAR